MRIFTYRTIKEYYEEHSEARSALEEWFSKTEEAKWNSFADIKNTFNSVDAIGKGRFVFNIKGNNYRLVAHILFVPKYVYIKFIGTHTEYDKIEL